MRGTGGRSVRGNVLEAVGLGNGTPTGQALVRYVGSGLGEGAEEGGTVSPAHGQSEGEGNEWCFPWAVRHNDTKEWDGGRSQRHTVETIRQVTFKG